jgi:hypothetical protein
MIRFLNLDLDFFVHGNIVYSPSKDDGRPIGFHKPWSAKELHDFLQSKCLLSKEHPVPGRFVVHHDGAFDYWQSLLRSHPEETTIDLTHVDAHADLGMGDLSFKDLLCYHLHKPVSERANPKRGMKALNHGSYIAYAVACRWLHLIDFVLHPAWRSDLFWFYFKDFSEQADFEAGKCLQLRAMHPSVFEPIFDADRIKKALPVGVEPEVPFFTIPLDKWKVDCPFDFALLAQSPNFVSRAADRLLGTFAEYIDFR